MSLDNLAVAPEAAVSNETTQETEKLTPTVEQGAPTEEKPETDSTDTAEKPEPTEAEKVKAAMQKRIDKQTAQRAALQRRIAELEASVAKPVEQKDDAPKEADFSSYEDYLKAVGKYEAKQEIEAKQAEAKNAELAKAYQAKMEAGRAEFVAKEAEFRKSVPDYDDAVEVLNETIQAANHNSQGFQVFKDILLAAPDLPALSYHLGKNPDLLDEMQRMEPVQIAWKLIETAIGLKKQKTETATLPPPPKAVGSRTKSGKDIESMSPKELLKWVRS